jgi:hypothetical protein
MTGPPIYDPPLCEQAKGAGPYTGGFTSRISRVARDGTRRTVVDGLPSSATTPETGALSSGVADVRVVDGQLYGIEAGAGCSHGLLGTDNGLFRVNADGSVREIANLSAYQQTHPVQDTTYENGDWEPDGTWYSMAWLSGAFYAVEPNHQEIDRIGLRGHITRVLDMSQEALDAGHWIGPTSISTHRGSLYFGTLSFFPIEPGSASIYELTRGGRLSLLTGGLTTVLGTAWDADGRLYALESMTAAGFPGPGEIGMGMVVRVNRDGTLTTVVTGLSFPSAMTFGPDGDLYVSNFGFGPPTGEILRVDRSCIRNAPDPACHP